MFHKKVSIGDHIRSKEVSLSRGAKIDLDVFLQKNVKKHPIQPKGKNPKVEVEVEPQIENILP